MRMAPALIAILTVHLLAGTAVAAPPTTLVEISPAAGNTLFDSNGDGVFESQTGDAPDQEGRLFGTDQREGVSRVWRTGVDFSLGSLVELPPGHIRQATLLITFVSSGDYQQPAFPPPNQGFPPPTAALHAYHGDGYVTREDALVENEILRFAPPGETTVELDVTTFIRESVRRRASFAGFTMRIVDDHRPGSHADAFYKSRHVADPGQRPRLIVEMLAPPGLMQQ